MSSCFSHASFRFLLVATDQLHFNHRCRFYRVSGLLNTHIHLYIRGSLTNGRKERGGEQRISTCEHREWCILVVNCFFFAALSTVIGQAGKGIHHSPRLSLSLCICLTNRQNENLDYLPTADIPTSRSVMMIDAACYRFCLFVTAGSE